MNQSGDYSGRRVLVTGAGGFIGSHLSEALAAAGARVRALVRYNSRGDWGHLEALPGPARDVTEVVLGDVRDARLVREAVEGCDVVFHLAALIGIPYSYRAPQSYLETNVGGTLNVLEAARGAGARVVHTSTSEVYGTARYTPIDESHPLQGQSPYSASKIGADALAESYHRSFGLPVVVVRPFNTYGPRQSARAVVPAIAAQLLAGRDRVELGSLHPIRDLTFVSDTVRGFLLAGRADAAVGQVINLGHGEGITIGELARLIMQVVGRDVPVETSAARVRPPASEVERLVAGRERAGRILGWEPQVSLRAGLALAVDSVRAGLATYKTDRYAM